MKKILELLAINPLFIGIEKTSLAKLLHCIDGKLTSYKKNEYIIQEGVEIRFMGIILSGNVKIVRNDAAGNTSIIARLMPRDFFGEIFVCSRTEYSPVSVQAGEDCEIYLMSGKKILSECSARCLFHTQLMQNLLTITASKALELSKKIGIISKRTTREKILRFLDDERTRLRSNTFKIPFNRQDFADYLCVDRSALSRELANMQREKLIRYTKNQFEICVKDTQKFRYFHQR